MRILKIYLVLILSIGIFYGFTFFINQSAIDDEESSGEKIEHFNQIIRGEIIPMEQWWETLVGQWEVEFTIENPTSLLDITGVITYREDSTFTDALSFKYYEFEVYDEDIDKRGKFNLKESGKAVRRGSLYRPDYSSLPYKSTKFLYRKPDEINDKEKCYQYNHLDKYGADIDFCQLVSEPLLAIGKVDLEDGRNYETFTFTTDKIVMRTNHKNIGQPVIISCYKINQDVEASSSDL
ncbi:MAG: hypothetical protein AAFO82_14045 [Bacteroidota bacterium]